jgi:hypothetical protein
VPYDPELWQMPRLTALSDNYTRYMRPSLLSAFRLVIGLCCAAAGLGLVMGVVAEWGVVAGALDTGTAIFVLVVLGEAVAVLLLTGLLVGSTRSNPHP